MTGVEKENYLTEIKQIPKILYICTPNCPGGGMVDTLL